MKLSGTNKAKGKTLVLTESQIRESLTWRSDKALIEAYDKPSCHWSVRAIIGDILQERGMELSEQPQQQPAYTMAWV
jgi:hypothetical protein